MMAVIGRTLLSGVHCDQFVSKQMLEGLEGEAVSGGRGLLIFLTLFLQFLDPYNTQSLWIAQMNRFLFKYQVKQ